MSNIQTHPPSTRRRAALALCAVVAALALAAALSACGGAEQPTARGCVVVDVSGSARPEITTTYLPGFTRFVQRIAREGSGDICFAFAASGLSGGASSWASFACPDPDDTLRCEPLVRQSVAAAAQQLVAVASAPAIPLRGASELVECLALIAPATAPGDEILVLSDAIENSRLMGNFADHEVDLDTSSIDELLAGLRQRNLLPDLRGRRLLIPYALTHGSRPLRMSATRQQGIRVFWERYATAAGARLTFGGGTAAI